MVSFFMSFVDSSDRLQPFLQFRACPISSLVPKVKKQIPCLAAMLTSCCNQSVKKDAPQVK
jgi:hypothetical protein